MIKRFGLHSSVTRLALRFEQTFDQGFDKVARDPKVLAFLASSINYAAQMRIEARKLETEIQSLRTRAKRAAIGFGSIPRTTDEA